MVEILQNTHIHTNVSEIEPGKRGENYKLCYSMHADVFASDVYIFTMNTVVIMVLECWGKSTCTVCMLGWLNFDFLVIPIQSP